MTSCSNSKGVALITGAGQGIGRAIAIRLASDGFDVGPSDLSTNKSKLDEVALEITSAHPGRRVSVLFADVTVEDDIRSVVDGVVTELGGLDVVSSPSTPGLFCSHSKRRWSPMPVSSTPHHW